MPYNCNSLTPITLATVVIAGLLLKPIASFAISDDDERGALKPTSTPTTSTPTMEAQARLNVPVPDSYQVQPGDLLLVSVWGEPQLQLEVLVGPDGGFSLPLAGEISAKNRPLSNIRVEVTEKLQKYVPDADVTVALKQIQGNKVYVIGKVNRPGEFVLNNNVDIMQALSMAGGATQFADVDDIIVLRRLQDNQQEVFKFDYDEVKDGENLQQNIILKSGDVIVVP